MHHIKPYSPVSLRPPTPIHMEFDYLLKLAVIGDSNAGKTSLVQRYVVRNESYIMNRT